MMKQNATFIAISALLAIGFIIWLAISITPEKQREKGDVKFGVQTQGDGKLINTSVEMVDTLPFDESTTTNK